MFSTTLNIAAAAAFAGAAFAAPTARHENCDPALQLFNLTVTSLSSGKYDGALLTAAHSGAAVEALAVLPPSDGTTSYVFNQTINDVPEGYCGAGYLQYSPSPVEDPLLDGQQLGFYQNATSNVAASFFGEGNTVLLAFSNEGNLFYYDGANSLDSYWYVCPESQLGYQYNVLSHVANGATPDNAQCDQVTVRKID